MQTKMGNERGIALIKALIVSAAILAITTTGLVLTRNDTVLSSNVYTGKKALWAAIAGAERAKDHLQTDTFWASNTTWPVTVAATALADGYSYAYQIDEVTPTKFHIKSTGTGPENSRKVIDEFVEAAGDNLDLAVVTIDGVNTHVKMLSPGGGQGVEPPPYSVDGRPFDRHGRLAPIVVGECEPTVEVRGPAGEPAQNDVSSEVDDLRCEIVERANQLCDSDGSNLINNSRPCNDRLWFVRGDQATPRFSLNRGQACDGNGLDCGCDSLDVSAPELHALNDTGVTNPGGAAPDCASDPSLCPLDPKARGPFMISGAADPYDGATLEEIRQVINRVLDAAIQAPADRRTCLEHDLKNGQPVVPELGSWDEPHVVIVPKNGNVPNARFAELQSSCGGAEQVLDIKDGRTLKGTGILVVGNRVDLADGELHWRGIIVIGEDGDLRIEHDDACGAVYGAVVLQDNAGGDPKVSFNQYGLPAPTCPNPWWDTNDAATQMLESFSLNYSCEAINQSLGGFLETVAFSENFDEANLTIP